MSSLPHLELQSFLRLNQLRSARIEIANFLREGMPASELIGKIRGENFLKKAERLAAVDASFCVEEELSQAAALDVDLITFCDIAYPENLKHLVDPPLVLYVKGCLSEEDRPALAIVGSRHPNYYGLEQAEKFACELSKSGITIISGFAKGIDQAAHQAALKVSYGRTVAVLGCGLDIDYPRGSRQLFERISAQGAVISEYAFGTEPLAHNFPPRNRIISGLSLGVLVVQAHSRSGSLITAHEALEQGREVFAIPGPVHYLGSKGTHRLLREGAMLVEEPSEILESLIPTLKPLRTPLQEEKKSVRKPKTEMKESQSGESEIKKRLLALIEKKPLDCDEIAQNLALEASVLSRLLLRLELERRIQKRPDRLYQYCR